MTTTPPRHGISGRITLHDGGQALTFSAKPRSPVRLSQAEFDQLQRQLLSAFGIGLVEEAAE